MLTIKLKKMVEFLGKCICSIRKVVAKDMEKEDLKLELFIVKSQLQRYQQREMQYLHMKRKHALFQERQKWIKAQGEENFSTCTSNRNLMDKNESEEEDYDTID